jgi:hypothetical protein|tara:strand:+ start:943 stop:1146 length:204 start_codon:yes stop_codon:yes gene_type:complete
MSYDKVIELIKQFPENRNVPRLIRVELDKARGLEKLNIKRATEALIVAANTEKDFDLIEKHLSPDAT